MNIRQDLLRLSLAGLLFTHRPRWKIYVLCKTRIRHGLCAAARIAIVLQTVCSAARPKVYQQQSLQQDVSLICKETLLGMHASCAVAATICRTSRSLPFKPCHLTSIICVIHRYSADSIPRHSRADICLPTNQPSIWRGHWHVFVVTP